jgi:hypothetical protein
MREMSAERKKRLEEFDMYRFSLNSAEKMTLDINVEFRNLEQSHTDVAACRPGIKRAFVHANLTNRAGYHQHAVADMTR